MGRNPRRFRRIKFCAKISDEFFRLWHQNDKS